jgi:diacylglycerol kinase
MLGQFEERFKGVLKEVEEEDNVSNESLLACVCLIVCLWARVREFDFWVHSLLSSFPVFLSSQ